MNYWWLSFADGDLPRGQMFLGVAICRGNTPADAVARAWEKGCNPGGEVAAQKIDLSNPFYDGVDPDRLLTNAELERLGVKQNQQSIG